jgi:hypothetical protein
MSTQFFFMVISMKMYTCIHLLACLFLIPTWSANFRDPYMASSKLAQNGILNLLRLSSLLAMCNPNQITPYLQNNM